MVERLSARAPAKVNLTLAIVGRREDGFHELDSLVAFAATGDDLSLEPGERLDLIVTGPRAGLTGPVDGNLVIKAARALGERRPGLRVGTFRLVKRLPAAAGLGGGSSDAAAALRLLARLNNIPLDDPALLEAACATGADVPVCLAPRMRIMRGIGDRLGPALSGARFCAVLVNPGVPVETAAVFRRLGLAKGAAHSGASARLDERRPVALDAVARGGNDLEAPAIGLAPVIAEALEELSRSAGCDLARMSGSGATVFGLFGDNHSAELAAKTLARRQPGWWVKATVLR